MIYVNCVARSLYPNSVARSHSQIQVLVLNSQIQSWGNLASALDVSRALVLSREFLIERTKVSWQAPRAARLHPCESSLQIPGTFVVSVSRKSRNMCFNSPG